MPAVREKKRCYQRFGTSNPRFKMEDALVRIFRLCRAVSAPPSASEMATIFEITERQANRLIHGDARREAGGPIEERVIDPEAEKLRPSPFLRSTVIRCRGCGAKAHPSKTHEDLCMICCQKLARGQL